MSQIMIGSFVLNSEKAADDPIASDLEDAHT